MLQVLEREKQSKISNIFSKHKSNYVFSQTTNFVSFLDMASSNFAFKWRMINQFEVETNRWHLIGILQKLIGAVF